MPPSLPLHDAASVVAAPVVEAVLQGVSAAAFVVGTASQSPGALSAKGALFAALPGGSGPVVDAGVVPAALQGLFAGLSAKASSVARQEHGASLEYMVFIQAVDFVGMGVVDLLAELPGTQSLPTLAGRGELGSRGSDVSARAPSAGSRAASPRGSEGRGTPAVVLDVEDGMFVSNARVLGPVASAHEAIASVAAGLVARRGLRDEADSEWRKVAPSVLSKVQRKRHSTPTPSLLPSLAYEDAFTPPSALATSVVKVTVEQVTTLHASAPTPRSTSQSSASGGGADQAHPAAQTQELRSTLWLVDVGGMKWLGSALAQGESLEAEARPSSARPASAALGGKLPPLSRAGAAVREPKASPPPPLPVLGTGPAPQISTRLPTSKGIAALNNTLAMLATPGASGAAADAGRMHPLTRLLQDALGLNAVTVGIGLVDGGDDTEAACATLHLCDLLSRVRCCPIVNHDPARGLIKRYRLQLRHARLAQEAAHSMAKRLKRKLASIGGGVPEDEVKARISDAVAGAEERAKAEAAAAAAAVAELEALKASHAAASAEDLEGPDGSGLPSELDAAQYKGEREKLLARLRDAYGRCAAMAGDKEETLNALIEAEEEKVALSQGLVQMQVWGDSLTAQLAAAGIRPAPMPGSDAAVLAFHSHDGQVSGRWGAAGTTSHGDAGSSELASLRSSVKTLQEGLARAQRELTAERVRNAQGRDGLEAALKGSWRAGGGSGGSDPLQEAVLGYARQAEELRGRLERAEAALAAAGGSSKAEIASVVADMRAELASLRAGAGRAPGATPFADAPPGPGSSHPPNIPPWLWYSPPWMWNGTGGGGPPGGGPGMPSAGEGGPEGALDGDSAGELKRLRLEVPRLRHEVAALHEDKSELQSRLRRTQADLEEALSAAERAAGVAPAPHSAQAEAARGGADAATWKRARATIKALKDELVEARARLATAQEQVKSMARLPQSLTVTADESTLLGQLQVSEKSGLAHQTRAIVLQGELETAERQIRLLLSKAAAGKRRGRAEGRG